MTSMLVRMSRGAALALVMVALVGCADSVSPFGMDGGRRDGSTDVPSDRGGDGAPGTCRSTEECSAGLLCAGPEGCGTTWRCLQAEGCTPDFAPFCGCDGVTFGASSSCPGRPYAHRGPCEGPPPPPPPVDAGGACHPLEPDRIIHARVLYDDQLLSFSAISANPGRCGCTIGIDGEGTMFQARACRCCDVCDCIDTQALVSAEIPLVRGPVPRTERIHIGGAISEPYSVVARDAACNPAEVTALEPVSLPLNGSVGGPRYQWIAVRGRAPRCCGTPEVAVRQVPRASGEIELIARECSTADCDGCPMGAPLREFETVHNLGVFPSGQTVTVRAGMQRVSFTVP